MRNMRKNAFEGDMEQLILDAINDRSEDPEPAPPPDETDKMKKGKMNIFGTVLLVTAILGGIAGIAFYINTTV
ncbi:MAG: hypothetical protein IJ779_01770 [Ruminococcus sp.]|nr:hypothetical protein [Ruminococcus sp.]